MRDVLDQVDIFVTTTGNKDIIMVRHRLCPSCRIHRHCHHGFAQGRQQQHAVVMHIYAVHESCCRVTTVAEAAAESAKLHATQSEDMSKMKNNAIVGNIGHFDNEIDMAGLIGWQGIKRQNIKPQVGCKTP